MSTFSTTIDTFIEAYNSGDVDRIAGCYDEHGRQVHVLLGVSQGRAAIADAERPMFAAFSDISWQATRTVEAATGDWHAVEWMVDATNTGTLVSPVGTLPATGRIVHLAGCSLMCINENGLIAEEHRYFNPGEMFAQLGLVP
jgi:SnoaL-like domain